MSRFAGAFGAALADTTNRWITEEMWAQRQQTLADMQRRGRQLEREDDASFKDRRAPVERQQRADDARASASTVDEIELGRLSNTSLMTARESAKDTAASGEARRAREAKTAEYNDADLQAGRRRVDADDSAAKVKAGMDATKAQAGDAEFLAAQGKIKLADPEVAARIAASRASTAASGAHASLYSAQAESARMDLATKKRLDGLYAEASGLLSDAALSDEERGQKMARVQQQIALVKSKNGQAAAKDPELDTETVKSFKRDDLGNITEERSRKEVRRPGQKEPASDVDVHAQARAAIAAGADPGKVNARLAERGYQPLDAPAKPAAPTLKDPLTGDLKTEAEYDRKFGRGSFRKALADEERQFGSIRPIR